MTATATLLTSLLFWLSVSTDGWLGVFLAASDPPQVVEVVPASPADKAGIQAGDRFLAVDDKAVTTRDQFVGAIRACKQGQRVKLKLQRHGGELTVVVQLGERPEDAALPQPQDEAVIETAKAPPAQPGGVAVPAKARPFVGVALEPGDDGMRVSRVVADSPAEAAGIAVGDVLVEWGDAAVRDYADLERALGECRPGQQVALQLRSGQGVKSVLVQLGRAAADVREASAARPAPGAVATLEDVTAEELTLPQADAGKNPVVALFGASWNSPTLAQRRVLDDAAVQASLRGCEVVFVDTDRFGQLAEANGVGELPQLLFRVGGRTVARQVGYLPAPSLIEWLRSCRGEQVAAKDQPVVSGEAPADVQKELQEIRAELRELRKLIEQLKRD